MNGNLLEHDADSFFLLSVWLRSMVMNANGRWTPSHSKGYGSLVCRRWTSILPFRDGGGLRHSTNNGCCMMQAEVVRHEMYLILRQTLKEVLRYRLGGGSPETLLVVSA